MWRALFTCCEIAFAYLQQLASVMKQAKANRFFWRRKPFLYSPFFMCTF